MRRKWKVQIRRSPPLLLQHTKNPFAGANGNLCQAAGAQGACRDIGRDVHRQGAGGWSTDPRACALALAGTGKATPFYLVCQHL